MSFLRFLPRSWRTPVYLVGFILTTNPALATKLLHLLQSLTGQLQKHFSLLILALSHWAIPQPSINGLAITTKMSTS